MSYQQEKKSCLVILSGGQDSTTCLFWALKHFAKVHAVTFDYGQRHERELQAAEKVFEMARKAALPNQLGSHEFIVIGKILRGASPLISDEKLEQYPDGNLPGGLEKTFVPGRNLLFLTLAANLAYSKGITDVVTGVCEEDYGGYPDCRMSFIQSAQHTIREGMGYINEHGEPDSFRRFHIHTPLMTLTKAETVVMARQLRGCWDALAYTHTAYDGQYPPVGNDHASQLRAKGFFQAGLPDPLVVRAHREGLMPLPTSSNYNSLRGV